MVVSFKVFMAYVLIVAAMSISLVWISGVAQRANDKSSAVQQTLFDQAIKDQKVCSATNQGEACRDLFDRLSRNISKEQRFRLGCASLEGLLPNPDVQKIIKDSHCPPR